MRWAEAQFQRSVGVKRAILINMLETIEFQANNEPVTGAGQVVLAWKIH
jgi:hypothetical protein